MSSKAQLLARFKKLKFRDKLTLYVKAGKGGVGLPKYGGIGGRGGNIVVQGDEKMTLTTLAEKSKHSKWAAGVGSNSSKKQLLGSPGQDLVIPVPLGTVLTMEGRRHLGEINTHGEKIIAAKGGAGGTPSSSGKDGHKFHLTLDLKLIADIGLVGFPNAGKSSLLRCVSRASPKVAGYPFTTLRPNLGVMMYEDKRQISMADLPGLIEGAHVNRGMGHSFLKHVERTKLMLFVVDIHGFQLDHKSVYRNAFETILLLMKELELFKEELVSKPTVLALNKIDVEGSEKKLEKLVEKATNIKDHLNEVEKEIRPEKIIKFDEIIPISAKDKINTDSVKERLRELLDIHNEQRRQLELAEIQRESLESMKSQLKEHTPTGVLV